MTMTETAPLTSQNSARPAAAPPASGWIKRLAAGLGLSILYALLIGGAIYGALLVNEQAIGVRAIAVIGIFTAGALLGAWFAVIATFVLARGWFRTWRRTIMFLMLPIGTIGITAFLHFLHFRIYFGQWHEPALTKVWIYQMAFTGFGALAVFVMMGLRLYLPFAAPAMLVAAWWFSRR